MIAEKCEHTPGTWTAERHGHSWRIFAGSTWIADIVWNGHNEVHGEANARLIAAAPDLLAACEAVLDGYDCPDKDAEFDWSVMAGQLRAEIAKARGEQPNRRLGGIGGQDDE